MTGKFEALDSRDPHTKLWIQVPKDWRRPKENVSYSLYWKDQAAFGQLLPRPTPQTIPKFYQVDDYYTHSAGATQDQAASQSLLWRALVHLAWRCDRGVEPDEAWWSQILGTEGQKILEIGCGNGEHLLRFKKMGHQVRGIEPDPDASRVAQEAGIEVYPGTAEELPKHCAGEKADLILMSHVLEHCLDPILAVQNSASLLPPGGKLVIEVPNNACLGAKVFGTTWHWLDVPRHLNFFTEASLRALLEANGFDVLRVDYRGYTRQFLPDWVSAQAQIAEIFGKKGSGGRWSIYSRYLLRTAFSSAASKYDSVRIVASKKKAS